MEKKKNLTKFTKNKEKFTSKENISERIFSSCSKIKDGCITPEDPSRPGKVPAALHKNIRRRNSSSSFHDYQKHGGKDYFLKAGYTKEPFSRYTERVHMEQESSDLLNPPLITRNIEPINLSQLNSLIEKDYNELLLDILDKESGFLSLFTEKSITEELMAYMLIALGKACSSDLHKSVNELIKIIWCNKTFLIHIQRYLGAFQKREKLENFHLDSIFYIAVFLERFQLTMPSTSAEFISILMPLLRSVSGRRLKDHEEVFQVVSEKLIGVESENERFLERYSLREMEEVSKKEKLHMQQPPENFRYISVLPTVHDINTPCIFLRPNIVKGKYVNTEHYLDVQFRLLREDYVIPLREGVAEYLYHKKYGKSLKNLKNVRVYSNTRIVGEQFVNGELLHLIYFPDRNFSKIKWDHNKRFQTGSLLCLSSDDFQNMLFATVAVRENQKLKEGLLYIHFENMAETIISFHQSTDFVVLETTSGYFQSYFHTLKVLRQLNEETLPFKSYIVDVEKSVRKPQYLFSTTAYDMRPLLIPLSNKFIRFRMSNLAEYDYPSNVVNTAQFVSVLDEDNWPSALDLNLDNSQYIALRTAATKEMAIIQGPPGTGKTFIGLRIAQLLLHNSCRWFTSEENSLPILVVCYTNHALDQFLEGLLLITKKIVRIGGRGKNEALSEYQLQNLKSNQRRNIPKHIINDKREVREELDNLMTEINYVKNCIEISSKTVLNERELEEYIPYFHFMSLKMGYTQQSIAQQTELTIYDWLNICSATANLMKTSRLRKSNNSAVSKYSDLNWKKNKNYESDDDVDIEFIENQRNIGYYDFEDSLFNSSLKTYNELIENEEPYLHNKKYRKENVKYIKKWLRCSKIMDESDALKVKNVWNLNYTERWQLYKFWAQRFTEEMKNKLFDLEHQLKITEEEIRKLRFDEDLCILRDCHVVGMTTTGAAKYTYLLQRLKPAILIVEEAAEILESHIITSLAPQTKHMILIGDHQQLRPSTSVHMLSVKYDLDISLFERMIKNGVGYCTLSIQHRMRPEISSLIVPHIYPTLENDASVMNFEDIKGMKKNVFFVTHTFRELQENDSKSKANEHEAKFLIQLCRYLILQGYDPSEITILTTYSGQLSTLKKFSIDETARVRFTVVDNFQGEENNIVLISFVRSNEEGEIGFLKVPNRVCVALSRAKKGLYCIGNFELLAKKSKLWKNIVGTLVKTESVGKSLQLICQNHPDTCNEVSTATDFKAVPNGGCTRTCDYRLPCGHCCPLTCHPFDHESIRCLKPCAKSCEGGHLCKKICCEPCGICPVPVDKILKRCGHTMTVACGIKESEIFCTFACEKILDCTHRCTRQCGSRCADCEEPCLKSCEKGHPCNKKCSDPCGTCGELVERNLPRCGHTMIAPCGLNENQVFCTFECKKILPCTHQCINKCGDSCVDDCKLPCIKTCDKGHPCQKLCSQDCGFCTFLVEKTLKRCGHKVEGYCGEPCIKICRQIKEVKSPVCGHILSVECHLTNNSELLLKKCSEELYQMCSEPCKTVLPCGHVCKGTCGSCYQGRLHVVCNERCDRILVCGHKCSSKCGRSCPPCKKPCENSCIHRKCSRKCGEICIKCTEPCAWSCRHKQCTRLCSEICNREACNEPCSLVLPCNHPCLGFCGEPCPNTCNICDDKHSATDKSKIAKCIRYILLEDCSHAVEEQILNNCMTVKSETENRIQLKTCPECDAVIRKNFRYGNTIKTSLFLLETTKNIYSRNVERRIKSQNSLHYKIRRSTSSSKPLCESLRNTVGLHKKFRTIQGLANIENIYDIISDFESLKLSKPLSDFIFKPPVLQNLFDFVRATCLWLSNFIEKHCIEVSESQLLQMTFEILRLRLINKLLNYAETLQMEMHCQSFDVCAQHLLNYSSFDFKRLKAFISAFRSLTQECGGSDSDKSLIFDFPFLTSTNMSRDSWNQCENGHVSCNMALFSQYQKSCNLCIENESGNDIASKSQQALLPENTAKKQHKTDLQSSRSVNSVTSDDLRKRSGIYGKYPTRKTDTPPSRSSKYGFKFNRSGKKNEEAPSRNTKYDFKF